MGQLSSTLDIPQLRQLEPFLEQMEIQVEQPQKDTQSLRILMASALRLTYICLSWTFSVTQSKGHSGLATFYGTGFGTCGWEKYTQAIMISSKKKDSNAFSFK